MKYRTELQERVTSNTYAVPQKRRSHLRAPTEKRKLKHLYLFDKAYLYQLQII